MIPALYLAGVMKEFPALNRAELEFLLAELLACRRSELPLRLVSDEVSQAMMPLVVRLAAGEPLAYILGYADFMDLRLKVSPAVLVPRADTEWLMASLFEHWHGPGPRRILDLGTGSGAMLLAALDHWPEAEGVGIDVDAAARAVARANMRALGFEERAEILPGHWFDGADGMFDLILANPPYVALDDPELEERARQYEPALALFADDAGMADIRHIIDQSPQYLRPGGCMLVECGHRQVADLVALMEDRGYEEPLALQDGAGRPRGALARLGRDGLASMGKLP